MLYNMSEVCYNQIGTYGFEAKREKERFTVVCSRCRQNPKIGHLTLLYLPTQIRFLIGGERVTCHWSKLHDALGRIKLHDALGQQQLELSTHTWSGRAPLKRRQICTPADVKQIIFICVLFYFELGGITKHLVTGPSENSEFCFPSTSMFPSASPRGTLRVSGKQNSLYPLGPVIKCLLFWRIRERNVQKCVPHV